MNVRLTGGLAFAAIGAALLSSCGSKNAAGLATLGIGTTGHIAVTPDPLNLGGIGASYAGTIGVTDSGYTGTMSIATTCSPPTTPIAQIAAPLGNGSALSVKVTPLNAGTCTITFSDSRGLSHTSTVNVTTSGVGVK